MKVAVVGAGWAGLSAAVALAAGGARVALYEAGRHPGGRARSTEIAGRRLDNGQHILLGAYRDTLALMRQVGADPERLFDRRPLRLVDNAGFRLALPRLPAPLNVAWGLLAAHGTGFREKLATAWWMQDLKRAGFRLPADATVATWLDAAGQTGTLRRHLWEPLCLAALNTPAERASAQLFANVLRDSLGSPRREATDLLLPRVTLGELLPEPAAAWLASAGSELRFGHRVQAVAGGERGVTVDGDAFDAAILAVAPQHLGKLLPEATVAFEYEPIATVYLQYSPETALPFPLYGLQGGYGQWVVDRGQGLLAAVISGHGAWEDLADSELAGHLHGELGQIRLPAWHTVIREKRATFSCRPGQARPAIRTGHPRLFVAGDHAWADYPATLEGAVRSGRAAAAVCLAQGIPPPG